MPIYLTAQSPSPDNEAIKARLKEAGVAIIFNIVGTSSHLHNIESTLTVCNLPMINDPKASTPKWKPATVQALTCARCIDYAMEHNLDIPIRQNTRRIKAKRAAFDRHA